MLINKRARYTNAKPRRTDSVIAFLASPFAARRPTNKRFAPSATYDIAYFLIAIIVGSSSLLPLDRNNSEICFGNRMPIDNAIRDKPATDLIA